MDIRTWQDADRADDARADAAGPGSPARPSYRARHRSARSPFSPLRPAPIAIGSLSTAAVAAVALVSPHLLHADGTASASPAVDGRAVPAGHVGPRTPGPATSTAPAANQGPAATSSSAGGPAAPSAPPSATPSTIPAAGAKPAPTHQPSGVPSSAVATAPASSSSAGVAVDQGRTDPGAPAASSTSRPAPPSPPSSAPSTPVTPVTPPSTPVTPPPTTPTSAPAAFNAAAAQQSALAEIAAVRHSNGIDQLSVDGALTTLATQHDGDMVKNHYFSHTGSDGSSPFTRALRANCWTFGKEIIARGAPGTDVIKALLSDPQAGQALTWGWYSTVGVSAQQDPATGQVLWTIELGWG